MSDKTSAKAQAWLDRYSRYQSVGMMLDLDEVAFIARAHVAQAARIAELERQLADEQRQHMETLARLASAVAREIDMQRQLSEARDQALEDAAAWLDTEALSHEELMHGWAWSPDYPRIAACRIRAMKGAKP